MEKYKYKNIVLFQDCGRWYADYVKNGKRFALHRASARTKADSYKIAKMEIDFLNEKERA